MTDRERPAPNSSSGAGQKNSPVPHRTDTEDSLCAVGNQVLTVLAEVIDPNRQRMPTVDYLTKHDIDVRKVSGFCGSPTVLPITLLPNRRFDLPDHGADSVGGVVIEARDETGEEVIDLVAWPVGGDPDSPVEMIHKIERVIVYPGD